MFSRVRFSNLLKASVLSCSALMLLSGVCYGQQQPTQTIVLISKTVGTLNAPNSFRGGTNPSISGDGKTLAYSAASLPQPAIVADVVSGQLDGVSEGINNRLVQGQATSVSNNGTTVFQSGSSDLLGQSVSGQQIYFNLSGSNGVGLISSAMTSGPSNGRSASPVINGNGNLVAYVSTAIDITSDSAVAQTSSVYLFDIGSRTNTLISRASATDFLKNCSSPAISKDGTVVAFISDGKVYVKRSTDDIAQLQNMGAGQTASSLVISADGSTLAYVSASGGTTSVIIDAIANGATDTAISVRPFRPTDGSRPIALSGNGRFLVVATADRLDGQMPMIDTNGASDIYLFGQGGNPTLLSLDSGGAITSSDSLDPVISEDGSVVAFSSGGQLTQDADINSGSNIFAITGAGAGGGAAGVINLGPVCFPAGQAIAPDTIKISWGFPGTHNDQLKGFKIQVNRLEGSTYVPIAKVPADGEAIYIDTKLKPRTKYNYRLWIENPKGFAYSVDFSAKTPKVNKK